MNLIRILLRTPDRRMTIFALFVVALDQITKALVLEFLGYAQEKVVVPGFFKLVHWSNTGAAFSSFTGNNGLLAIIAFTALVVLYFSRHHFDRTLAGQIAFSMICGGILGNLIDRVFRKHVIDFLYFYLRQPGGTELGFPAFNVADSAICTGVALVFLITWRNERRPKSAEPSPTTK